MSEPRPRRAAVTGIGVVAPNGSSTETFWKSTREGISVLDRVTREGCERLPLRVAGQVRDFDPSAAIEERFLVQTDRFTHFAMAAADLALDDARLPRAVTDEVPFSVGVVTAAGSGGGEFGQRELQQLWGKGSRFVGPYQSIAWFYAASTGQISIRRGFKGPCSVVAADEAGGLDALAHAARAVRRGTDVIVAGATEAPIAPYSVVCQLGYEELSTVDDPTRAYRPFTSAACGFVPAEGGAMVVVEASQVTAVSATKTATPLSAEMTVGARSPCRYVATASPANSATITRSPAAPRGYTPPAVSTARMPSSWSARYGMVARIPVSATTSARGGDPYRPRTKSATVT
ncbi:beta-ketoacyl synthase N-terminal-like domain-containing protein [Streptomyces sp. NPDC006265]|uniref:beta-ketoacyl synthase N-terminal-like domain-containing protein n=1 Tax=Streptomyces sp. NPDC006265 TaxID=3156740 RepID=UPI0033BF188F